MVLDEDPREAGAVRVPRRQQGGGVLEGDEGVLVLEPRAGQVHGIEPAPAHAVRRASHQLVGVGGPARADGQAAEQQPRVARSGHVLSHPDRRPVVRGRHRRDVEVLAHVVLVGGHRCRRRERRVVGEHRVDDRVVVAVVGDVQVPAPGRGPLRRSQREPVAQHTPASGRLQAGAGDPDPARGRGAEQGDVPHPVAVALPQVDVGGPGLGGARREEQEAEPVRLERGEGAVLEDLDRQPGRALEPVASGDGGELGAAHDTHAYQSGEPRSVRGAM